MTVTQLIRNIRLGVQRMGTEFYYGFEDEELLVYLNDAYSQLVNEYVDFIKADIPSQDVSSFVKTRRADEALTKLISINSFSGVDVTDPFSIYDNAVSITNTNTNYFRLLFLDIKQDSFMYRAIEGELSNMIDYYNNKNNVASIENYMFTHMDNKFIVFYNDQLGVPQAGQIVFVIKKELVLTNTGSDPALTTTPNLASSLHVDLQNLTINKILEDVKSIRPSQPIETANTIT